MIPNAYLRTARLLLLVALLLPASLLQAQPGTVDSHQKISDTEGGFFGSLSNNVGFGWEVTGIGDLDNDGVEDIAVGVPRDDTGGNNRGAVWIIYLNSNGTVKFETKIRSGSTGFTGPLADGDNFGSGVAGLGDLDGDGVEDIAVGASGDNGTSDDNGAVWILFLNTNGTVKAQQKLEDDGGGPSPLMLQEDEFFGTSVANLGDLDGDGVTDLVVGADGYDAIMGSFPVGAVWVVLLNNDGTIKGLQRISESEGGFGIGLDMFDSFGDTVTALGDLDGDGVEDFASGAPGTGTFRGAVWVVFLNTDGTVKAQQEISDTQGNFTGPIADFHSFGSGLTGIGDLNTDGIMDLVVGAPGDGGGAAWVLFLNTNGTVKGEQKITEGVGGFTGMLELNDFYATALATPGDIDNDGIPDLVAGATGDNDGGDGRGAVYVLFMNSGNLPVELTGFDAVVDQHDVHLTWHTASETNNAGFELQQTTHRSDAAFDWQPVAFINGAGTTTEAQAYSYQINNLAPGRHWFRLKQIDFDGGFEYSLIVEVTVKVPGTHVLSAAYPNPFNPSTQFELTLAREQHVQIEAFDVAGRQVQTLHSGVLNENTQHVIRFDTEGLPGGLYVIQVVGESFTESGTVTLVK